MNDIGELEQLLLGLEQRLLPGAQTTREDLEELLDPEFCEFGSSGVAHDRMSIILALVAEREVAWSITDFKARPLAEGVVLVTYVAMKSGGGSSLRSSIWKRSAGRWKMAFHQGTKTAP